MTIQEMIVQSAIAHGVDPNLALAVAFNESGFSTDALSYKGAIGVMQLMPTTAQGLGVDPYNVQQNIDGGILYLKQQLNTFGGDEAMAAAAYNAGPNGDWSNTVTTKYANDVVGTYQQYAGQDYASQFVAPSSVVTIDSGDSSSWLPVVGLAVLALVVASGK